MGPAPEQKGGGKWIWTLLIAIIVVVVILWLLGVFAQDEVVEPVTDDTDTVEVDTDEAADDTTDAEAGVEVETEAQE